MIVTFYSYKGGVGRSMALANVADLLARSGLRVLMVDFDLEAPGLENFFPIADEVVRGQEGLLDLLLTFKYSMSVASSAEDEGGAFRHLDRFIATIYPPRSDGGGLDLLTAGRRGSDEQMLHYGVELRRFDWIDFYFSWSGELFFEWLRRVFAERYDVVLVDSRTGVTEMGGICAYQLADAVVVFCAPNLQNLDGTGTMVRNFLSPEVRKIRRDRPMDVLIVPARVDQEDAQLRGTFERRFNERFASYLPPALASAGLTLWDMQIPYEPRYAFDEQVVTDPERSQERRGLAAAYGTLVKGIATLAPGGSPLAGLGLSVGDATQTREPVETRYDPTTRFAGPDIYILFGSGSENTARRLVTVLEVKAGLVAVAQTLAGSASEPPAVRSAIDPLLTAKVGLVLVGKDPVRARQLTEIAQLLARDRPVLLMLLPGSDPSLIPIQLQEIAYLDLRAGLNEHKLISSVHTALSREVNRVKSARPEQNPYRGSQPFREEDAHLFFGRSELVQQIVAKLETDGGCAVVGPARSGKTSLVFAGLITALRQNAIPGSDRWPIVPVRLSNQPHLLLIRSLASLLPAPPGEGLEPGALGELLRERFQHVVLVADDLETLLAVTDNVEREKFDIAIDQLHEQGIVIPILVARPEFLDEATKVSALAHWFRSSRVSVRPLGRTQLREAIEEPARLTGLVFEPGLVDRLLSDVPEGSAALPILQSTLQMLWHEQRDGYITHRSYEALGGMQAELIAWGERAVSSLSDADLLIARTLLLRMVMVTDGRPHRRDAVEFDELMTPLETQGVSQADTQRLITLLADHTVLTIPDDPDKLVRVAIAHEALVQDWPRLAEWVRDDLASLAARSRLDRAAQEWWRRDRDESVLLTPQRMDELLSAMATMPLSSLERAYTEAVFARAGRVDFLLSYAGQNRDWAEWIAWQIVDAGYAVLLDIWDVATGRSLTSAMTDALSRADRVLVLFSAAYFQQWASAFPQAPPELAGERLVAVCVEPVAAEQVPPGLRSLVYHDVFELPLAEARQALLKAVTRPDRRTAYPGRGTPGGLSRLGTVRPRLPGSVPEVWKVPRRNPGFVGRDDMLAAMRDRLLDDQRATVQALVGMGGVGTTQLAVEYAYRFANGYDVVWWIAAEEPELIGEQFAALASELGSAPPGMSQDMAARGALTELQERDRWLLIFDNARAPQDLMPWLPGGDGHMLITSRTRGWDDVAVTVQVDVLARTEAVVFLRGRVPGLSVTEANQLAEALGDLPLALAQAAGVLASGLTSRDYMRLLSTQAAAVLDEGRPTSYPRSLAAAAELDFRQLRDDDPVAAQIVVVCACLAPEPIPTEWFTRAPWLLRSATDQMAWRQLLNRIGAHGLAAVAHDGLRMHRLTQAVLRDYLGSEQTAAAHAMAEVVLVANDPGDPFAPPTWPAWARLLPHLLAVDAAATDHLGLRDLACRAASYLLARGDARSSRNLAERLHEGWRDRLGPDNPLTLQAAEALAAALQAMDTSGSARVLSEETMTRRRRVLGEDHPDTLRTARLLAADLRLLGEVRTARELDEDTLARSRQVLGEDHPDTLRTAGSLSADLRVLGEYQAARELAQDTLAKQRQVLGEDHPDTLRTAGSLSADLRVLGEYQAARELAQDTLAKQRQVLGEDHPDTLRTAGSLSADLRVLGEVRTARELDEDTLARSRQVLGEDHPDTLRTAGSLSADLRVLGEVRTARELDEDTLARSRQVLGEDHPDTLRTARLLAADLRLLGEVRTARELDEDTLARSRQVLGEDHPDTLRTAGSLSADLRVLGEYQAARELAQDTLAKQRQVLGEDHPDTLRTAGNLGVILFDSGNRFGARKLLEQTLAGSRRTLGANHPQTRQIAQALAHVVATLGGHSRSNRRKARKKGRKK